MAASQDRHDQNCEICTNAEKDIYIATLEGLTEWELWSRKILVFDKIPFQSFVFNIIGSLLVDGVRLCGGLMISITVGH
jgi:hypothetical protein